jgi:hypothetical protein
MKKPNYISKLVLTVIVNARPKTIGYSLKLKCNSSINLSSWQTNHRALPALASSILPRRELEVNVGHFK